MLTQKRLKEVLRYNQDTGAFTWNEKISRKVVVGKEAGSLNRNLGYIYISIEGVRYLAHRLAWLYTSGAWPKRQIDHIDHNRENNSIYNLRDVSHQENSMNQKMRISNTSGYIGVMMEKRRGLWRSEICVNGKGIFLGYFTNKQDAVDARRSAQLRHGFHANHGGSNATV